MLRYRYPLGAGALAAVILLLVARPAVAGYTHHAAYRIVLRTPLTAWTSQGAYVAAQRFVAEHPAATALPPGLQGQIACELPAGAHVWVQPFDSWKHPGHVSRFAEVSNPGRRCDGVARIAPGARR